MSWFSFFITFAVSWWVILFMLLPVGVNTPTSAGEVEKGHASSAPKKASIKKKMLWATVLSALFSYLFVTGMALGYLDFLEIR